MKKTIMVIMGTVRQNRASEQVTNWVMKNLPKTKHLEFEVVDLRDWHLPFFDEPLPPLASEGNYELELGQKWLNKVKAADGFLIVTGEYNHSIPGVLKNALDYWYSGFVDNKPVSFVSYGAFSGGIRAVEHLRQVALELKLIPLHDEVNLHFIWEAFGDDGQPKNPQHLQKLHSTIKELDEWFDLVK